MTLVAVFAGSFVVGCGLGQVAWAVWFKPRYKRRYAEAFGDAQRRHAEVEQMWRDGNFTTQEGVDLLLNGKKQTRD